MASIRDHLQTLTDTVGAVRVLQRSGALDLTKPRELATAVKRSKTLGAPATIMLHGAEEHPDAPALTDERGTLTFGELNDNAKALANELLAIGLTPGSVIGVLARDHRGLLTVLAASGFAGVRLAMMNTGFGKTQFAEVAERERVQVMFYDEEFIDLLDGLPDSLPRRALILVEVPAQAVVQGDLQRVVVLRDALEGGVVAVGRGGWWLEHNKEDDPGSS